MTIHLELQEELTQIPLTVQGKIPSWLEGTLVRNGPVRITIDGKTNNHWFDGLAMLHNFSFANGQVVYSNKFLRSEAYNAVFEKHTLNYLGFACDPCRTLFQRFLTLFFSPEEHAIHNANINVAKIADQYVALTEIPLPVRFDLETLQTLGVLDYNDALPKDQSWEAAHPHVDQKTKETISYLVEYGRKSHYIIYRILNGSSEREVIARIPVAYPSYMHSFALTENYIILAEYPFTVKPLELLLGGKPFITNYSWHADQNTTFTVVDRKKGTVVGRYQAPPFFAFHHVNAYEWNDTINLDIIAYPDAKIVNGLADHFWDKAPDKKSENEFSSQFIRYTIHLKTGKVSSESILNQIYEFPRIHPAYNGKEYRFAYLADPRQPITNEDERSICKMDVQSKQKWFWSEKACYPGEPVFVPAPQSTSEDDGVVMTVIWNKKKNSSFLLVLDGKTFQELGRAEVTHPIPAGLHGQFFP